MCVAAISEPNPSRVGVFHRCANRAEHDASPPSAPCPRPCRPFRTGVSYRDCPRQSRWACRPHPHLSVLGWPAVPLGAIGRGNAPSPGNGPVRSGRDSTPWRRLGAAKAELTNFNENLRTIIKARQCLTTMKHHETSWNSMTHRFNPRNSLTRTTVVLRSQLPDQIIPMKPKLLRMTVKQDVSKLTGA